MKRTISMILCLLIAAIPLLCFAETPTNAYIAGTYTSTISALHGPLTVEVTLNDHEITAVEVVENYETYGVGTVALETISKEIVEQQSLAVDMITGATVSSACLISAVKDCIQQANGDIAALTAGQEKAPASDIELTADVVVVGGGGAGMCAAISALETGASVILIEKMGFVGGNSIASGGIYNAPDPEYQDYAQFTGDLDSMVIAACSEEPVNDLHKQLMDTVKAQFEEYKTTDKTLFDSNEFFALQTWNAGDKVGDLSMILLMAQSSLDSLHWVMDMGMEIMPAVQLVSGSLYPRTHNALEPNGTGYFKAFENKLSTQEAYTQMLNTTATGLIMDGDKVVGVRAQGKDGNNVILHANNGVVLATGGFAGNVELRQEYCQGEKWPDLGSTVPTTNMPGVTGDGIFFARGAGAALVNMEQIQLVHLTQPKTGKTQDNILGDIFVNREGTRFVKEDGRRDEISKAIIAQTEGVMYSICSADRIKDPENTKSSGGMALEYMIENKVSGFVKADTIAELAEKLGMPADALEQTISEYNSYFTGEAEDPLGRIAYTYPIVTAPYYALPRSPAVHHTMGGVLIDEQTHALHEDGSIVEGLYCAGEITGVLHGANRVGGNAMVDFVVFGRIAGENAGKAE